MSPKRGVPLEYIYVYVYIYISVSMYDILKIIYYVLDNIYIYNQILLIYYILYIIYSSGTPRFGDIGSIVEICRSLLKI